MSSRRAFLEAAAASAAGLLISFYVPRRARATAAAAQAAELPPPNAFLRIGSDDSVTVLLAHSEMGQSVWTSLAILVAEELDCDWSKVRPKHAPAAPVYAHPILHIQVTATSSSTYGELDRYRTVGAIARDMLVRAAAERWKVAPASCRTANGIVRCGDRRLSYGQLAEEAMKLKPPKAVKLKAPEEWKIIGTPVRRLDTPEKITGKAEFGIDVQFPGLRTAVVARPPSFGAMLIKFDATAALQIPGVEKVVRTADGVAVVASHFWAAKLGRDALAIDWKAPEGGGVDSDRLLEEFRALAGKPGAVEVDTGDVESKLAVAKNKLEVLYEVPYLAHAPMEPLNATVKIDGDRCEIWTGTQMQTIDQLYASKILGTTPEKVTIHTPFLGGGFGRRGSLNADFVAEAVIVAKTAGVPVKTVWTREDDTRGGYYRPAYLHRIQVGLDGEGRPIAWDHVVVGQSIATGSMAERFLVKNGVDHSSVEGISNSPYLASTPARRVSLHSPRLPVPVLFWRAVGNTHTAFAMEGMIDELAHAAGKDALAYRLELLRGNPRSAGALELAADKAGWGEAPPPGRARGLAVHESFGTIVAQVAEVSAERGRIRVHAFTCAVDCGTVVNPLGIEAQIQSSVAYGLSAALYGKITLKNGAPQESNFHDYRPLRMVEMPRVSVHIVRSTAKMGGIGEPAVAPIAPAVANAVFALTGQRLRTMPFRVA